MPLVIEPSPSQHSGDAGLPPLRQFDRHVGPPGLRRRPGRPRNTDDQGRARQPTLDRVGSASGRAVTPFGFWHNDADDYADGMFVGISWDAEAAGFIKVKLHRLVPSVH